VTALTVEHSPYRSHVRINGLLDRRTLLEQLLPQLLVDADCVDALLELRDALADRDGVWAPVNPHDGLPDSPELRAVSARIEDAIVGLDGLLPPLAVELHRSDAAALAAGVREVLDGPGRVAA
jgi:hypothetical protein